MWIDGLTRTGGNDASPSGLLLNQLVRAQQQRLRDGETERLTDLRLMINSNFVGRWSIAVVEAFQFHRIFVSGPIPLQKTTSTTRLIREKTVPRGLSRAEMTIRRRAPRIGVAAGPTPLRRRRGIRVRHPGPELILEAVRRIC